MPPAAKNKTWIELLACPACRGGLDDSDADLTCRQCGRRYPIRDGIPQLLLEDAVSPSEEPSQTSAAQAAGKKRKA